MVKRGEIEVELEIFLDLKWITEVAALLMNSEIKAIVYAHVGVLTGYCSENVNVLA